MRSFAAVSLGMYTRKYTGSTTSIRRSTIVPLARCIATDAGRLQSVLNHCSTVVHTCQHASESICLVAVTESTACDCEASPRQAGRPKSIRIDIAIMQIKAAQRLPIYTDNACAFAVSIPQTHGKHDSRRHAVTGQIIPPAVHSISRSMQHVTTNALSKVPVDC
jgi:hypothetical protein